MEMLLPPGHELPFWAESLERGRALVADDVSNAEYHGARALVSKSALDVFSRSPAHYLHYLETGLHDDSDKPEPEALVIGSAFHALVLEPMEFSRSYVLLPDFGTMVSSKNRALRDAWLAERPGIVGLKAEQWRMIHGMRESLMRHKKIRRLLENGRPEVTCAALDPHTGLPRKCRWDWVSEIDGLGVDLKSARDAREDRWKREAMNRRYEVQDAYYTDTGKLADLDVEILGFAVVEKEEPYVCALYTLGDSARLAGEIRYMRDLEGIAKCCDSGDFPGYGNGDAAQLEYPKYAVPETETIA